MIYENDDDEDDKRVTSTYDNNGDLAITSIVLLLL